MCFGRKSKKEAERRAKRYEDTIAALRNQVSDLTNEVNAYNLAQQEAILAQEAKEAEEARIKAAKELERKKKAQETEWKVMHNNKPVPVAQPSDRIQLTPVVQPIPLVPYSSQLQPLAIYNFEEEYEED